MRLKLGGLAVIAVLLGLAVGLCSCEKWQLTTVSYEGVGEILSAFKDETQGLCRQGELDEKVCAQVKDAYNKSRGIYIEAGDVLIDAMRLEDTAERSVRMGRYSELIGNISTAIHGAVDLLRASGVRTDKIDAVVRKFTG